MIHAARKGVFELVNGSLNNSDFGNPGLVLAKFLEAQPDPNKSEPGKDAAMRLIEQVSAWSPTSDYENAYTRWLGAVKTFGQPLILGANAITPLAIGLGSSSPLENGLALNKTYGTPYLPGSALKGLLRRVAQRQNVPAEVLEVLAGTTESAGHIIYWDAWLDPGSTVTKPFQADVITTHHPKYYGQRGQEPPSDFDDPTPIAFVSIKPGVKFTIALSSTSENAKPWLDLAAKLLIWGLRNLGVGGKTNAGYGYLDAKVEASDEEKAALAAKAEELLKKYQGLIASIDGPDKLSRIDKIIRDLSKEPAGARRPALLALRQQMERASLWKDVEPRVQRITRLLEEQ